MRGRPRSDVVRGVCHHVFVTPAEHRRQIVDAWGCACAFCAQGVDPGHTQALAPLIHLGLPRAPWSNLVPVCPRCRGARGLLGLSAWVQQAPKARIGEILAHLLAICEADGAVTTPLSLYAASEYDAIDAGRTASPVTERPVLSWRPDGKGLQRRILLARRDGLACVWCARTMGLMEATVEHLRPRSSGGTDSLRNLTLACAPCNHARGAMPLRAWVARATHPDLVRLDALGHHY